VLVRHLLRLRLQDVERRRHARAAMWVWTRVWVWLRANHSLPMHQYQAMMQPAEGALVPRCECVVVVSALAAPGVPAAFFWLPHARRGTRVQIVHALHGEESDQHLC